MAGAGGMLGEAFYQKFNTNQNILKCSDIDLNENWLSHLDFRIKENYEFDVKKFNPDWLFHIGAYTDLEYCELNQDETYKTNTESVKYAVQISNSLNIPLLYISTAGIFDGKKELYSEDDLPNPIGHYAKSKYLGEKYVIDNSKDYLICRAGWMMGGGVKKDKKFVKKIIKQIHDGKQKLHVVNDKLGTPTFTFDFADNTKLLIEKGQRGLFNMVCSGVTSRLEVAHEIIKILKYENKIDIIEVDSDFFNNDYFADRPYCERLENKRLNELELNIMRNWKIALNEYIQKYY